MEHTWDRGLRAFLYMAGLLWCFLGVSVLSDTFMAGIEAITNSTYKKKVPRLAEDGTPEKDENGQPIQDEIDEQIWNAAVANLTLMALGSSTPEILLSIIEIVGNGFFSGDLGPGTVVGSASFNLYVITGICMLALEAGEVRKIEGVAVYSLTASHSLVAYVWLAIVVTVISPDVVEWWEALITFLAMPWLVTWVYCADKDLFNRWFGKKVHPEEEPQLKPPLIRTLPVPDSKDGDESHTDEGAGPLRTSSDGSRGSGGQYAVRRNSAPDFASRRPSAAGPQKTTYLTYRRQTCAAGAGALKSVRPVHVVPEKETPENSQAKELMALKAAINESFHISTHCVYHWETATYGFPEIEGQAKITIIRTGKTEGSGKIKFRTEDGTAKQGATYETVESIVNFEPNETSKHVFVPLIHDYEWNSDLDFYVILEAVEAGGQIDKRSCKTTVTVVDTDKAGTFAWSKANNQTYNATDSQAFLLIERRAGFQDTCFSKVQTRDGTALANVHYRPMDTLVLEWKPYEMAKQVSVRLLRGERPATDNDNDWTSRFYVDVTQVSEDGAALIGEDTHTADVRIDHRAAVLSLDGEFEQLTYGQQIRQAMNVNAGGPLSQASVMDCIMHWLSIGWKLLAALIPPPHWAGGWACFCVALMMIGCVTAIIGDLASIFGCLVGLKDSVTAFTIVALGTSLPDTFASVLAIRADESADNAIGNVTGSNSVNVFLGLGFPWLIASIYWSTGATDEWHEKYKNDWDHYDKYKSTGAFVVKGGSLGFNTMIFSILTCFVFVFLYFRRVYVGGEIGGSKWGSRISAIILISVWFIYVLVSALQVYHADNFIEI